ncbi:MAG: hypothetical protein IBJ11_11595 [Phycisphaerales bacterium]|nr:hypothetical protein [Phycisphaerales bacterium]
MVGIALWKEQWTSGAMGDWASPNWNPAADIDGNGSVGANDLTVLLVNFGRTCP